MVNQAFINMVKADFNNILQEQGDFLEHSSKTNIFNNGYLDSVITTTKNIYGIIRPIEEEEGEIEDIGEVKKGNFHGRFSIDDEVKEGDYLTSKTNGTRYEVIRKKDSGNVGGYRCFDHYILYLRPTT